MATYMIRSCDRCKEEERYSLGDAQPVVVAQSNSVPVGIPILHLELCLECYLKLVDEYKE